MLLTSDVREQQIHLRVPGGKLDIQAWSENVAQALLPGAVPLFPRHRWLNSVQPIASYALISNIHNVLPVAGELWLGASAASSRNAAPAVVEDQWALDDSDDEKHKSSGGDIVPAVGPVAQAAQGVDSSQLWMAFNKQQKGKAKRWCASQPRDRLLALIVSLDLGLAVLRGIEYVASDRWQVGVWARTARGGEYDSRILTAAGGLFHRLQTRVLAKLETPAAWECIRVNGRTGGLASRAFSSIYVQACALEQLMLSLMLLSPFILFVLVTDPCPEQASKLLSTPECLRCEFMKAFLKVFHDEPLLLSARCRAILIALAVLARYDICRIECRHNVIRTFAQMAPVGWAPVLEELSAKFMCVRGTRLQNMFSSEKKASPWQRKKKQAGPRFRPCKKRSGPKSAPTKQRVGGGGAQRAFFSRHLKGVSSWDMAGRSELFTKINKAFKEVVPGSQDALRLQREAQAGTASYAESGAAFGRRPQGVKRSQAVMDDRGQQGGQAAAQACDALALQICELGKRARANLDELEALPSKDLQRAALESKKLFEATVQESTKAMMLCQNPLWKGLSHAEGVADVKGSPQNFDMSVHPVVPPAASIVQKTLEVISGAHSHDKKGDLGAVQEKLLAAWSEMHVIHRHEDAGKIPELPAGKGSLSSSSDCRRAGVCLCGEAMKPRRSFRTRLASQLKSWLAKGKPARLPYDQGRVVLRFRGEVVEVDKFFFLGYGNLNDNHFTVLPLRESSLVLFLAAGQRIFHAGGACKELDSIGASLNLSVGRLFVSVWVLEFDCKTWIPDFTPCAVISELGAVGEVQIWPVVQKQAVGIRLPIQPLRALVAGGSIYYYY